MPEKIRLTSRRVETLACPSDRERVAFFDADTPGLALRVSRSGARTFYVVLRVGSGRSGRVRWLRIGNPAKVPLAEARRRAREILGRAARGEDPVTTERGRREGRLGAALDAYDEDLARREIVNRAKWMTLLRRELYGHFGDVELESLDRPALLAVMKRIEAEGLGAKAADFRQRSAVFLNWCVDRGLLSASPLAGWRRPRSSRAERLGRTGRALEDDEIPLVWRAFEAASDPGFRAYLQILLLLGQRRTETALMRWADVDLVAKLWSIPAEVTKSGRSHRLPLPAEALRILSALPRRANCPLVFPGRDGRPMTGWSKRMQPVQAASRALGLAPWTLHDLRRTVRTGLARLGIPDPVAERVLGHAPRDPLLAIYNRYDRVKEMGEALEIWSKHVMTAIKLDAGKA